MKKVILILLSFLTLSTFADTEWSGLVHVRSVTISSGMCIIAFQETISYAPSIFGRWQVKMPNVTDAQYKAMLALLLEAKANNSAVRIMVDNARTTAPANIWELPNLTSLEDCLN